MGACHTLHMHMEGRVDAGISTTALIHDIEQYYQSYVSKGTATGVAAAVSTQIRVKACDVCGGEHWIRECPVVLRAKELFQEEARVAATTAEAEVEVAATAVRGMDFWDSLDYDQRADGTEL